MGATQRHTSTRGRRNRTLLERSSPSSSGFQSTTNLSDLFSHLQQEKARTRHRSREEYRTRYESPTKSLLTNTRRRTVIKTAPSRSTVDRVCDSLEFSREERKRAKTPQASRKVNAEKLDTEMDMYWFKAGKALHPKVEQLDAQMNEYWDRKPKVTLI